MPKSMGLFAASCQRNLMTAEVRVYWRSTYNVLVVELVPKEKLLFMVQIVGTETGRTATPIPGDTTVETSSTPKESSKRPFSRSGARALTTTALSTCFLPPCLGDATSRSSGCWDQEAPTIDPV